jgi:TetR/AcrR family transcriptional repressor of nem operon
MRKSKEATAESRQRILTEAARLYRERGFDGVGVADIMEAAGMTHGGFYRHFRSKEALIAEAVAKAFADRARGLESRETGAALDAVRAYVGTYLSPDHVAHPEIGCPMAAVGSEAPHAGDDVARAFRDGAERIVDSLSRALKGGDPSVRPAALRLLSILVGAVVVARSTGDRTFQAELLKAVRSDPCVRQLLPEHPLRSDPIADVMADAAPGR